ncbi:HNH endonuclease [Deinococcus misasensis]|uniref:HNH endonuclease n=1 Tax=Deinococcus misasensis TaxID=392413 RepID=UPI00068E1112|nr:HNH endonuclease [Deinococcus misasensis]
MPELPLHGKRGAGKVTLVDSEWLDRLQVHKWYLSKSGYACTKIQDGVFSRWITLHHLIRDEDGGLFIDHINGNKLDNRVQNLRSATKAENNRNRKPFTCNKSGFKGVTMRGPKEFEAKIHEGDKQIRVGTYPHPLLAAIAYNAAALALYKEFAYLNPIPENYIEVVIQDLASTEAAD